MSDKDLLLAEVAVSVPVFGTFHYRVNPEMEAGIEPGFRVLVPFGRRRVTGYVMDRPRMADVSGLPARLKEIISPLDDAPLFGPGLVPFFRFIARYYHYPIGQLVAEALPAGLNVASQKTVSLTQAGTGVLDQSGFEHMRLTEAETALLGRLQKPVSLARLTKKDAGVLKLLKRFESMGWVEVESRLEKPRVRAKTEKWLIPATDEKDEKVRLGHREKELLALVESEGPLLASELSDRFSTLPAMMKRLVEKGRLGIEERPVYRDSLGHILHLNDKSPELNEEQKTAVAALGKALEGGVYSPFLLYGVTGSGKTEVYLAAARQALDSGRSALLLVPEISLTPALEGVVRARFQEDVAVIHSGLGDGERYDQWLKIRRRKVRLVLGARSAVFAPIDDLGLIVVDEEHDGSYKQDDRLRYQARDLALLRGQQAGAVVVLGSATPSVETFHAAVTGRYNLLTMQNRVGSGKLPGVKIIDMRLDTGARRRQALTPVLKKALAETLERGEQAMLFINRRGTAGLPFCLACGYVHKCANCSVSLTLHQGEDGEKKSEKVRCHYCGFEDEPPRSCPQCGSNLFKYMGIGTERVEKAVGKAFPEAVVARLDADTARPKGEMARVLEGVRDRKIDVLVGTQMITKGHDFPGITLVGVIEADLGLHLPDFRSGERTFQLLAQVGGRAGRGGIEGQVFVQTYSPEHYALLMARHHDYLGFFEEEIRHRRELGYPPFSRLALIGFKGNSEERTLVLAEEAAGEAQKIITGRSLEDILLLGPAPAPLAKIKGKYRYQILIRSRLVKTLHIFLDHLLPGVTQALKGSGVAMTADVDPHHML